MFGRFVFPHRWPAMNSMTDVDRLAALDVRDQQLEDWLSSRTSSWQCTSTSRPRTPPQGTRIYETDTGAERMWDGTGWVIMSEPTRTYTPSAFNITVGTGGTLTGTYQRSNGWMDLQVYANLGSAGFAVNGNPIFGLPSSSPVIQPINTLGLMQGQVIFNDATGNRWYGTTYHDSFNSVGAVYTRVVNTSSGIPVPTVAAVSNIDPFPWAAGDYLLLWVRFQMSTRYS